MAFYKQDIVDVNLETGVIHRSFLNHTIGHKDDDADRFGIRAFRNGEPVDLSGAQCQAVFMAPDGTNIALTSYGTVSGNEAYVTLPQACYNVEGQFCLAIKLVGGGVTATVRIIDGVVDRTGATGAVAPTEAVPTYQEILAVYAEMQEDVADYESVVATQNGKIDDLKSALIFYKFTIPVVSTATTEFRNIGFKTGDYIRITNNTGESINVSTNTGTPGDTVQNIGNIANGATKEVEITSDAAYFRAWIGSTASIGGSITVIHDKFGVIELDDEMDSLSHALGNYAYVETPTNITFAFSCTSGKKYVVKVLSGSIALYTRSTASGSNVQTIIPSGSGTAGTVKVFQPSNTTNYLRVESSASNSIIVGEYDGIAVLPYANEKGVSIAKETAVNGEKTTRDFLGEKIQFLPTKSKWSKGYWGADKTITVNNSYRAYSAYAFPAGTYYLNNYAEWQSFVENINTGDMTAIHYIQEASGDAYKFTVDYPFNVYISSSQVNTESMFANATLPSEYVFGVYPAKSEQYIIHVEKDGSGDFTTLVEAINFATQYMDSVVYVGAGTWDLIDELGSTYIESVSDTKRGLVLKNRIHVIFASNSKVTCNYTGSRSTTKQWLSAFNSGAYGFTLENARIYSDNVRYTVHDERDQDTDAYRNEYKNCKMVHSNGYFGQCIGGGLGTSGEVIIKDCYFNNTTSEGWREVVSYHNTAGSGRSFVDVSGCYFEGNHGVRFSWYGQSPETDKSTMSVHGNSFGRENGTINNSAETPSSTIENTEIIAYNNEFRN